MSAFTGEGFKPTEKELRGFGSKLGDELFRKARTKGMEAEQAYAQVYIAGAVAGGLTAKEAESRSFVAGSIYQGEKIAGRHHGEALDEVFLSGYVAGREAKA